MRQKKDPLLLGPKATFSVYWPEALVREIDKLAAIDEAKSRGEYAADLLVAAVRIRYEELADEANESKQKRP